MSYTAKWGPKSERPCKYVYGEMVPLTDEQMEEREALTNAPCSYQGATRRLKGAYTMSKESRDKLYLQHGIHFEDHAQYKRWCKANKRHDMEKGEPADESWRIFSEWTKGGQRGPCPLKPTLAAQERPEIVLSELQARMEASGEMRQKLERMRLKPDQMVRLGEPDPRWSR